MCEKCKVALREYQEKQQEIRKREQYWERIFAESGKKLKIKV